jgi:hypothetical protein
MGSINKVVVQANPTTNTRLYLKNNQNKKSWGHGSSGSAPSKHETLSSNLSTTNKNREGKKKSPLYLSHCNKEIPYALNLIRKVTCSYRMLTNLLFYCFLSLSSHYKN